MNRVRLLPLIILLAVAASARAQETDAALSAICTDRPTKSNAACTVDPGHVQYEADLVNFTRLKVDGVTTDTWLATNPTLKYGVTKTIDVELNIAPWVVVRTHDDAGSTTMLRGPGDLFARAKWNFYSDDKLTATALPYVKAPTARHGIGNGAIESGMLFPINYQLTDKITLTTVPEFDSLKDADGRGHHFNTSQLVNVGYALPYDLNVYAELWGAWNVDPARTVRQYSADFALTWAIRNQLQLDVGVNAGLNRNTPSVQVYIGISQKF